MILHTLLYRNIDNINKNIEINIIHNDKLLPKIL